ncbi:NAD-dependent epimerase/dehydratase family protein [Zhouia amylolytica]|uniref:NAD-dependent epimerase/dehydratase family protein n=1 Tax=Zhouia amylolytica TaxID=376730 RepID=UPI0020CCA213|nr:NAD(P)-dependent oxidoreductase [Zhouia amylolytica]MCQ0113113.1 NAD-dependent epimerase/dehydratase family protein [Zhouia amylolytica]
MKNILVFGGCGFLGFYLVRELTNRGYKVTIADVFLRDEQHLQGVDFIKCDIFIECDVKNVFEQKKFDVVYNLAGFANLDSAIKQPIKTMELNVLGNMYILEQCLSHGIPKYVYASSAYAMSNKGSFYGISKLASEKIIEEYHKRFDLSFTILRYGSVYSERAYDNNYIYNLIKKAVLENRIEHGGDGEEIREYIHAADAAKLSVDVIESEEFNNIHVVLTGTERMKRGDLFNMINEIMNNNIEIIYSNSGYHNHYKFTPYSFEPSVSKKLIANPHIDMGQGILECIRAVHNKENV